MDATLTQLLQEIVDLNIKVARLVDALENAEAKTEEK